MRLVRPVLISAFYLAVVIFGVACLATSQFRSSTGSAYDTWRLNLRSTRLVKNGLEGNLERAQEEANANWKQLKWIEYCVGLFDPSGKLRPGVEERTRQEVEAVRAGSKEIGDLQGEGYCVARGFTNLKYDKDVLEAENRYRNEKITYLRRLLTANEEQYSDLTKGHQEFVALNEVENNKYTKLAIVIPYDLLVLFLVMSMGALGGMIRILRDYGAAKVSNPSTKDYFLIPVIGAIVAIGGYILAKTGLLLLSSTKGETSLSPFMIGLVGMIAGLLAKDVIDRIAEYGRSILKGNK